MQYDFCSFADAGNTLFGVPSYLRDTIVVLLYKIRTSSKWVKNGRVRFQGLILCARLEISEITEWVYLERFSTK